MTGKIRFRQVRQFFNTITENIGDYDVDSDDGATYQDVTITDAVTEYDFYRCFLYLKSGLAKTVYKDDGVDRSLTTVNIDYMAAIMAKPLDFTMPAMSKNSIQQRLAEELGRTPKSAYSAINRLKKAQYLTVTEDNLIMPNEELQTLRRVTKKHINALGVFPVSYVLNFVIKNDFSVDESRRIDGSDLEPFEDKNGGSFETGPEQQRSSD